MKFGRKDRFYLCQYVNFLLVNKTRTLYTRTRRIINVIWFFPSNQNIPEAWSRYFKWVLDREVIIKLIEHKERVFFENQFFMADRVFDEEVIDLIEQKDTSSLLFLKTSLSWLIQWHLWYIGRQILLDIPGSLLLLHILYNSTPTLSLGITENNVR